VNSRSVSEARHDRNATFYLRLRTTERRPAITSGITERRRNDALGQPNAKTTVTVVETVL